MFYLLLIPICYLIFLASADGVELVTADLGRHITNGKLILDALTSGLDLHSQTPLFNNFYSYTLPGQETMNHHWLSGVVFHILNELVGFDGLELINIFLIMAANIIFFFAAKERSNKYIALLALAIVIPITCMRREVRPESFSYVFMALVFLSITLFQKHKISKRTLFILVPIIQLIWINLHLFFIFGLFSIACFSFSAYISHNKQDAKIYLQLFLISIASSLINPAHIWGVIEPLMIFKGYGYMIAENQSVFFMQKRSPNNPLYLYFEVLIGLGILLTTIQYKKIKSESLILNLCIFVPLILAGLKTNRIMPVTAFYGIPVLANLAYLLTNDLKEKSKKTINYLFVFIGIFISIFLICTYYYYFGRRIENYKFNQSMNNSAQFILQNNIPQPVFNNFDIGGYFIYHLFPRYRPFVDNRPEAYRSAFFDNYYNAMLKSEDKWYEIDKLFNFQTIYFMRQDATENAQPFLIRRLQDTTNWAPVYVDNWTIILIKRNTQNQTLINQFELPAGMFKVVKN